MRYSSPPVTISTQLVLPPKVPLTEKGRSRSIKPSIASAVARLRPRAASSASRIFARTAPCPSGVGSEPRVPQNRTGMSLPGRDPAIFTVFLHAPVSPEYVREIRSAQAAAIRLASDALLGPRGHETKFARNPSRRWGDRRGDRGRRSGGRDRRRHDRRDPARLARPPRHLLPGPKSAARAIPRLCPALRRAGRVPVRQGNRRVSADRSEEHT